MKNTSYLFILKTIVNNTNLYFSFYNFSFFILFRYAELFQVVKRAIVDVEIYVTVYTRERTNIGMLPEFPFALVLHLIHIVMGNPVGVVVESIIGKVCHLELIARVDDWLDVVLVFHDMKPCEDVTLEILHGLILSFYLHVKDGWQVARLKFHFVKKEISLITGT